MSHDQGWDSPTLKLYYHSVWLALFYWKTILVEKTVIVELYESLPWIMTSFVKCSHHDLNNGCFQILATTSGSEYQTSKFSQILFPFDLHWSVFEIYAIKLLPSLGRFHKVGCMVQRVAPNFWEDFYRRNSMAQMDRAISMIYAMRPTFIKSTPCLKTHVINGKNWAYYMW